MGNAESQQPGQEDERSLTSNEMRTCYYEVLEVERSDATSTEDIKKVYIYRPFSALFGPGD